jgi:hypothetical protein
MNWYKTALFIESGMYDIYQEDPLRDTRWEDKENHLIPPFLQNRSDASQLEEEYRLLKQLKELERRKFREMRDTMMEVGARDPRYAELKDIHKEAEDDWREQFKKIEKILLEGDSPDSPYSIKNENQEETYLGGVWGGLPLTPIKDQLIDDWLGSSSYKYIWLAAISDKYDFNLREFARDSFKPHTGQYGRYTDDPNASHRASPIPVFRDYLYKPEDLEEKVDERVSLWEEGKAHKDYSPKYNMSAARKAIDSIQEEARDILGGKNQKVYRGMPLQPDTYKNIVQSIRETGSYTLKSLPAVSFTTDIRLARSFSRFGEGGRQRGKGNDEGYGIVISAVATPENILMHYKQPTFQRASEDMDFHIGKSSQKEIVLVIPDGRIELTRENLVLPDDI